jgi:hypothetical protein
MNKAFAALAGLALASLALCLTLSGPANATTGTSELVLSDGTGDVWGPAPFGPAAVRVHDQDRQEAVVREHHRVTSRLVRQAPTVAR